jgi:hypothetical protein
MIFSLEMNATYQSEIHSMKLRCLVPNHHCCNSQAIRQAESQECPHQSELQRPTSPRLRSATPTHKNYVVCMFQVSCSHWGLLVSATAAHTIAPLRHAMRVARLYQFRDPPGLIYQARVSSHTSSRACFLLLGAVIVPRRRTPSGCTFRSAVDSGAPCWVLIACIDIT